MKTKKTKTTFEDIIDVLHLLHDKYPNQDIMKHIVEATHDYKNNLWMLNDKEFLFALNKYKAELELNIVDDKEIEKIISDATNLENILHEDEDDEFFNVNSRDCWI